VTEADLLRLADSCEAGDCPEGQLLDAIADLTGRHYEWRPCQTTDDGDYYDLVSNDCPKNSKLQHDYTLAYAGEGLWMWWPSVGPANYARNPIRSATAAFARKVAGGWTP
jgi:hypothetical protein